MSLARRAVACSHWRWMPGIRDANGDTVVMVKFGVPYVFCWDEDGQAACASTEALPDLTDPLSRAALRLLVREAWMCPQVSVRYEMGRVWRVRHQDGALLGEGVTEAEALVAALEAAGGEE